MWDTQNGWVHKEATIKKQQISAHLDAEIDRLHTIGRDNRQFYTQADSVLFREDADALKRKTDYQKGTWINAANKTIAQDRQKVARDKKSEAS